MASGKRTAGRELNHDNWNDEEEGEEVGEFRKATEDEIQKRVRKVAKRRIVQEDSENAPNANPFSAFGGFGASKGPITSTPAPAVSSFSFLSKIASTTTIPKTNGTTGSSSGSSNSTGGSEFLSKVKALNIAYVDWIKSHVDENPLCDLTPVFHDYQNYMKEFEKLKNKEPQFVPKPKEPEPKPAASTFSFGKPTAPVSSPSSSNLTTTSSFSSYNFGGDTSKATQSPPKPAQPAAEKGFFSFSTAAPAPVTAVTSTFSFGSQNAFANSAPSFGGLSASSTKFSFGNTGQTPSTEALKETTEDADEEPPKNDFKAVVEDDSLYSKRCKVFVKGASDFADRGVGTLYIKKIEGNKIQMIVRADTNLGNILLNIMIVDGLPASRTGKNNVMLVCIPTPEAKPPPTSVLLRVKTEAEADELLNTIKKYKK